MSSSLSFPNQEAAKQIAEAVISQINSSRANPIELTQTELEELRLAGNSFTDLSPLRGLTSLQYLELTGNDITDITPLSGLTSLMQLDLRFNPDLTDIEALFENPGIGTGDIVELRHTNVSCTDQARLAEKGVEVRTELFSSCATASRQR